MAGVYHEPDRRRKVSLSRFQLSLRYAVQRPLHGQEMSGDAWSSLKNISEDIPKHVLEDVVQNEKRR